MELAWAAGLFDGEGTTRFEMSSNGKCCSLRLTVPQKSNNIEVLERFRAAVGGIGNITTYRLRSGEFTSVYKASSKEAFTVINLIMPYLSTAKRTQAERAISLYNAYNEIVRNKIKKSTISGLVLALG